jgi:hypothetical protein
LKSGLSAMMGLHRGRDGAREVEQTQENLRERCNAYMGGRSAIYLNTQFQIGGSF